MKKFKNVWILALQVLAISFASAAGAETVNITLLQLNDIYEITPVSGGKSGGMARVATLRQQLVRQNPRTYTILAGDCLSPSALGTAEINGVPLAGQQMVAVMNAVGFDYVTFGNHEFDLPAELFYKRLQESRFRWFSSNVFDVKGKPFEGVSQSQIIEVKGDRGATVRVGLIGVTLESNHARYVTYRDPIEAAREQVQALKGKVDILVAVTHLSIEGDRILAETVPEIDIILGGHEHENIQEWRGSDFTPIFKADSNARTVYIHNLYYDTETRRLKIEPRIQPITDEIPDEPETAKVVSEWVQRGYQAFREKGFNPEEVVATTRVPLDGLEASVRNRSTHLTDIIARAMLRAAGNADLAVFNAGSIRIDDVIPPGPVTQYDVIRILPFGGNLLTVNVNGELLQRLLEQGRANKGTGGYLHAANVSVSEKDGSWEIGGKPLDVKRTYRVAIDTFLANGKETGLDFLSLGKPGVELIEEKGDIRFAAIAQLRAENAAFSSEGQGGRYASSNQ